MHGYITSLGTVLLQKRIFLTGKVAEVEQTISVKTN